MHCDYQIAIVMFLHGAPANLGANNDWELTTIGDPLLDLAWVLMGWPNPDEDRTSLNYVDYNGMPTREELAARYAEVSGRPVDDIDYYVILARFKMAIVLEGGYARYMQGGADNSKMEAFGAVVLDMAHRAAELARTTA
jgi:aminoglycoside phosphotransferase (APT) family kinase protein